MTTRHPMHRMVTIRMLAVSVLVGMMLAVGSVPYGTLVREAGFQGWAVGRWPGEQRGVAVLPETSPLGDSGQWVASSPYIEMDPMVSYTPGFVTPETLPAVARRHVGLGDEAVDVYWSGYPFKCAVGWWVMRGDRAWLIKWGQVRHRIVVTPLRPMWVGLLGNTLVYAAVLLVPWTGVRFIRTRRRRARARCVACAYELGAGIEVCPECGLAAKTS